jgi:mevalonate kinase
LDKNKIDEIGFCIVNTNQPKNTKDLVSKVRAFKESQPSEFFEVVNAIGDVT